MAGKASAGSFLAKALFDENKHKRGSGGKFASKGGAGGSGGAKKGGSVAAAHAIFDKMKGQPKAQVLAAAQAAGINPNTAKTQLYHWQKAQAQKALAEVGPNATKADLKQAAAKVLGVKPSAAPAPKAPSPVVPAPKPATPPVTESAAKAPDLKELGPTKYVHALADHMKGQPKKAVIEAAVKAGVNKSTAGVQYGKWQAKQNGEPPQLKTSPEPKALQAKQPDKMSDKELDEAIASYQGKLSYKADSTKYAPKPYNSQHDYQPGEGGKALTAKMQPGDLYTHPTQGKTFYKSANGNVYEHSGTEAGKMTLVYEAKPTGAEAHYDPATKILYAKINGVLQPVTSTTPVFKSQQKSKSNATIKNDSWSALNGVSDVNSNGVTAEVELAWKKSGVKYDGETEGVISYTGSGYEDINYKLREAKGKYDGKGKDYETKWTNQIDEAISKSSFKEDTIMWRGVGQGGTVWNGAPPPADITDYGFTSTSYRPDVAKRFSDNKTLFRVKVPKGFPGLNIAIGQPSGGGKVGLNGEAEVLLPRGTTYRVVKRHPSAGPEAGHYDYLKGKTVNKKMDVVDLEPVLPAWYIAKYGQPKAA